MIKPRISIVVPCYNQGAYLSYTLDSVLAQTFDNWECIVVNDGSTDNTEDIALRYCSMDRRFNYISQSNQGVSCARNNAILRSVGDYILPLDGDDVIMPQYIEKSLKHFDANPKTKLVYCKTRLFGTVNKDWNLPDYNYKELLWGNMVMCSAVYRREDWDKTTGYSENMRGGFEDWDFWLKLLSEEDEVFQIPEVLFLYRQHGVSRNSIAHLQKKELTKQIVSNHKNLYEPFLDDIVWLHSMHEELEKVMNSYSYRLGRFIIRPLGVLKAMIGKM